MRWWMSGGLFSVLLCLLVTVAPAVAARAPGTATPKAPAGVVHVTTPEFKWSKATRAVSYQLRIYRAGEVLMSKSAITGTRWTPRTSLPTGVGLTWKVRARNAGGYGAWSRSAAFSVVLLSPSKAISSFSLASPAVSGFIDEAGHAIRVDVPSGTDVTRLVAVFESTGVEVSVAGVPQVSGVTANDFTHPVSYRVMAEDGSTQDYLVTVVIQQEATQAFTYFGFVSPAVSGYIDQLAHTIEVEVPSGTDVRSLVAVFESSGAVAVAGVPQVSGVTANNFTQPVTYTVTGGDGRTQDYVVTVFAVQQSQASFISFGIALPPVSGYIDQAARTVEVEMPPGTDVRALVAVFQTEGAQSVIVGGVPQVSGVTVNDFSSPLTYRLTGSDGSTRDYVVTVFVPQSTLQLLTSFGFVAPAVSGYIDQGAGTVEVEVPWGTDVRALVAVFQTSGVAVNVGSVPQVSGVTANDFTQPVTYRVKAADGGTRDYLVSVFSPQP